MRDFDQFKYKNTSHDTSWRQKRGFFGIGIENCGKAINWQSLMRSGFCFGAHLLFTVGNYPTKKGVGIDNAERGANTMMAQRHVPVYHWQDPASMDVPEGSVVVGVELTDDADVLPHFHHPSRAFYVLGSEIKGLTKKMIQRCDMTVKIPTRYCLNVAISGAIVMYDRIRFFEQKDSAKVPMNLPG